MYLWVGGGGGWGLTGCVGGFQLKGIGHGQGRKNVLEGSAEHLYISF